MEKKNSEKVVILGASDNPERYSHKAMVKLEQHGHVPILVSPKLESINGIPVYKNLNQISEKKIDTLTVYVKPSIFKELKQSILDLKPSRIIFNPGTEAPDLYDTFIENDIQVEEACTLVLLSTGQF